MRSEKGHGSAYEQQALLGCVRRLVPDGARVSVVGDSEFGAVEVLEQLEEWGWHYVPRQKRRATWYYEKRKKETAGGGSHWVG